MKPKILIISSWYPSATSPISGCFIHDQALILKKLYDVCVLAPTLIGWGNAFKNLRLFQMQIDHHDNDIKVYRPAVMTPPGISFYYSQWIFVYYWILRYCFEKFILPGWGKPDLIHCHVVLPAGWAAFKLGQNYEIPVVLTEHSGPFTYHLRKKSHRKLVNNALTKVDHVIAVSPYLAKQILEYKPNTPINVIGNVIRTDFFSPMQGNGYKAKGKEILFLTVALLTEGKGIQFLLDAVGLLAQQNIINFRLIIAGDGPARSSLEKKVVEYGFQDNCMFTGTLSRSEVRNLMNRCDVFVLPSMSETFGVVLGEAMACGKPVIATRSGGPEFIVTPQTGVLVPVASSAELAKVMSDFIAGRISFDAQIIRQTIIDKFGSTVFLKKIKAIYEPLMNKLSPKF